MAATRKACAASVTCENVTGVLLLRFMRSRSFCAIGSVCAAMAGSSFPGESSTANVLADRAELQTAESREILRLRLCRRLHLAPNSLRDCFQPGHQVRKY